MIRSRFTYANVVSTLALVIAVGAGSAFAIDRIGSNEIQNGSIRSVDLKDRRAVKGSDVKRDSLTNTEVDEGSLVASKIVDLAGNSRVECNPESTAFVVCAQAKIRLNQRGRVLGIATGGQKSGANAASAECQVRFDGGVETASANPGEITDNTSNAATNGFARTRLSEVLDPGVHLVTLECDQLGASDVAIESPTIAAIAIGGPR